VALNPSAALACQLSPLTLPLQCLAGALYGLYAGLALSWLASSLGQALAFLLGRYLFRATVKAYLLQRVPNFPQIVSSALRSSAAQGALQRGRQQLALRSRRPPPWALDPAAALSASLVHSCRLARAGGGGEEGGLEADGAAAPVSHLALQRAQLRRRADAHQVPPALRLHRSAGSSP
jgi:hypothetical protein